MLHAAPIDLAVRRETALALLAAGESISSVCRSTGVARSTLRRWSAGAPAAPGRRSAAEVLAATEAAAGARIDALDAAAQVHRDLAADLHRNLEVLQAIRDDEEADVHARVRAAMTLLDRGGVVAGSRIALEVAPLSVTDLSRRLLEMPDPAPASNREAQAK